MPATTKPIYRAEYRQMLARLRDARKKAGLTQAEVAASFGRPQSFVSKCESGERRIDPTDLKLFATLYRMPVIYFLDDRPLATGNAAASAIASALGEPTRSLPAAGQDGVPIGATEGQALGRVLGSSC